MAKKIKPTTLPFGKFLVRVYDPTLEKWSDPCGFRSKQFTLSTSVQETVVPYCHDPDAVAETERKKDANSTEFTGSGVMALEDRAMWQRYRADEGSWNVRIELVTTRAKSGGYWEGNMVLTQLSFSSERGQNILFEAQMLSDGAVDWVDAAA